jgi:hypothetical protein
VPRSSHSGCAHIEEVETTNSKVSAKQEDESGPHPSYSPDVAPYDLHGFGHVKDSLRERRFADDDLLEHYVCEEPRRFSKKVYSIGLQRLT